MNIQANPENLIKIDTDNIEFADIFEIEEIQRIQDLFSDANGVASLITHPDGTPITKPSNFCRLCNDIIRKTEKGLANCFKSDAIIGRQNSTGPISRPCLSGGLWDAGASITVGGKHIANWLIGQVRSQDFDKMQIIQYADEIGANRNDFLDALNEVPFMQEQQFKKIAEMLYVFVNELSAKAYSNLQLKIQIAETEKARKLSQISEEKFRLLIDLAADAFFQVDALGNFIEVNKAASELTAYTRKELLRMNMEDLFSADNLRDKPLKYDLLLQGETIITERQLLRKDGVSVFVEMNSKKMPDGSFQSFIRNITERKQIEDTLKENETKYRDLVENSPDAIVIYEEQKVAFVNNACLHLILASCEEELIGKPVIQFVYPDYRSLVISRMKQLDTEGVILPSYEEKFIRLDGSVIDVEVKAMSLKLHDKVAVQLIIRDISERKAVENALRESKDKFKAIANYSASWEAWFSPEGKLLWMNSNSETFTGYTPEEYISAEDFLSMTISPEDITWVSEKFHEALLHSSEGSIEARCLRKDGSHFCTYISWRPIYNSNGSLLGLRTSAQDISELKRTEELLREKQKQLSDIIEFLPDATLAIDKEKRIIIWNKAIVEMTGIPASEMMGKGNYAYTIPFYGEARSQLMDLVFENNKEVIARYPYIKRDGDTLTSEFFCNALYSNKGAWIFAKVSPLHDEYGNIIGAIESLRDITLSRQANDLLKESERKLSTLMNNLQGMAYSCLNDKDWTLKFVNEGSYNLTEYLPDELINNKIISFNEISHPDDREMVSLVVQDAIINKTSYALEYRIVTKRGFVKHVWDQGQVVFTSDGTISHLEGFVSDITERKHAERALKESEERFRLGFDNANVGMCLIDTKGKFLKVNQHFCDMLGYNINEMDGMNTTDITHPDYIHISQSYITQALNGEIDHSEFEKAYLHKEGKLVLSRISFSLVRNADGKPMYFISHVIDITESKRINEELAKQKYFFEQMFMQSSISTQILDREGWCERINSKLSKIFGVEAQNIEGKVYNIFQDEAIKQSGVIPYLEKVFNEGKATEWEVFFDIGLAADSQNIVVKGKKKVWYSNWAYPIFDKNGNISNVIIQHTNISDRKQAEESLKENEERFRAVSEYSFSSICTINEAGKIIWANEALVKMGGYSKKEIYAADTFALFLAPESKEFVIANFMQFVKGEKYKHHYEFKFIRSDGGIRICEKYMTHYKDSNGNLNLVISMMDITERKQIQQALKESEDKYRTMIEYSNDLIWLLDNDGNFTFLNEIATKATGLTLKEWKGKSFIPLIPEEDISTVMDVFQRTLNGEACNYELHFKKADDSILTLSVNTSPVYIAGKAEGIVSFGHDITERKHAENKIKKIGKHYQALIEKASDGIVLLNAEGNFKFASSSAKRMFGYSESEEIKGNPVEYTHPEDLHFVLLDLDKLLKEPSYVPTLQYRFRDKNGNWKWIESTFTNLLADPSVESIVINFRDITERKQDEVALKEKMEDLQRFHNISVGRELKMIELKKEVNELLKNWGKEERYKIVE